MGFYDKLKDALRPSGGGDPAQPARGLATLRDASADYGDRVDALTELAFYNTPEVHAALLQVGANPAEEPDILEGCGERLGEFWSASGAIDAAGFARLAPPAQRRLIAILQKAHPHLATSLTGMAKP